MLAHYWSLRLKFDQQVSVHALFVFENTCEKYMLGQSRSKVKIGGCHVMQGGDQLQVVVVNN